MNRVFLVLLFVILLTSFVYAADVAYILKYESNPEDNIISALNDLNLTYDLIDDSEIMGTSFDDYLMIIVNDDNFGSLAYNIPVNEKNSLFLSKSHIDEWSWASTYSTRSSSQTIKGRILIQNSITQGFTSPVTLSNSAGSYYVLPKYPSRARSIDNIISTDNFDQYPIIASVEPGDLLRSGVISEARGLFFGLSDTDNWNNNAKQIFKRSVVWVLYGGDRDNDGVYDEEDNCIDNYNPSQLDSDNDGLGDACDVCPLDAENDVDSDGVCGNIDNCELEYNPLQENFDLDSLGDVCDEDIDNDNILNEDDECEFTKLGSLVDDYGCAAYQLVVINEVELNPVDETQEYVELYNKGSQTINLAGWKIKDSRGRIDIISSGSIASHGYFVFEEWMSTLDFMNNDNIQLLDNENYLIDETGFLEDDENDGNTWQRVPDGSSNWVFQLATKGLNNEADVIAPVVELIAPENGEILTTDTISFNYRVTDNKADLLNCYFYADFDGTFRQWANETISAGVIGDFIAVDVPDGNFVWNVKCSDGLNEAFASANKSIIVDDTPYLISDIPSQNWNEDNSHELDLKNYFADEDNNNLTYNVTGNININGNIADGIATLTPNQDWNGFEEVRFRACDEDKCIDSNLVHLIINPVNDAPVLQSIASIIVNEGEIVTINANATDVDGGSLTYTINDSRFAGNNPFIWQTGYTDAGNYEFEIGVSDGLLTDSKTVEVEVLPNTPPVITGFLPNFNPIIAENGRQDFSISWNDTDSEVEVRWYVDNVLQATGGNYSFNGLGIAKDYEVKAIVDDGEFEVEHVWNLETSLIPVANNYDGSTTDFSGLEEEELINFFPLILEKTGKGKIQFLDEVDLRDVVAFDNYADITSHGAGIDTDMFPSLKNKRARITFYNLSYDKTPTIYYNSGFSFEGGSICGSDRCSNINYSSGILSFDVTGFSTFIAGETRTCSQQGGFIFSSKEICTGTLLTAADTDSCCSIKGVEAPPRFEEDIDVCENITGELIVQLKNPGNNEKFELGDTIEVEVKIKNPDAEDIRFDVEVYLFNIDEENVEKDFDDRVKVDAGKTETLDFEINIDEKLNADEDYAVFVLARGENTQEYCNQDYKKIKIEREEDRIIIDKIKLEPEIVNCGSSFNLNVNVKNIGDNDEDVYLVIENKELGIYEKTSEFNIEEAGEKDTKKEEFMFNLGEVESGKYNIDISVNYQGELEKASAELQVSCELPEQVTIKENGEKLNQAAEMISKVLVDEKTGQLLLLVSLIVGIVIILALIIIVVKKR